MLGPGATYATHQAPPMMHEDCASDHLHIQDRPMCPHTHSWHNTPKLSSIPGLANVKVKRPSFRPPPLLSSNTHPPCPAPPLVLAQGRGVTWSTQNFCYGSLCCCVGDCVVRHCHLYPLYSWQDILLTFAEMELDDSVAARDLGIPPMKLLRPQLIRIVI